MRNHGAVPQIKWEEHRLAVNGLVAKPTTFTMDDLLKLPAIDVTCTLTCVGEWGGPRVGLETFYIPRTSLVLL